MVCQGYENCSLYRAAQSFCGLSSIALKFSPGEQVRRKRIKLAYSLLSNPRKVYLWWTPIKFLSRSTAIPLPLEDVENIAGLLDSSRTIVAISNDWTVRVIKIVGTFSWITYTNWKVRFIPLFENHSLNGSWAWENISSDKIPRIQ